MDATTPTAPAGDADTTPPARHDAELYLTGDPSEGTARWVVKAGTAGLPGNHLTIAACTQGYNDDRDRNRSIELALYALLRHPGLAHIVTDWSATLTAAQAGELYAAALARPVDPALLPHALELDAAARTLATANAAETEVIAATLYAVRQTADRLAADLASTLTESTTL